MNQLNCLLLPFVLATSLFAQAQEREPPSRSSDSKTTQSIEVFSGPQIGEKLSPFKVRGVFGDQAGKDMDFVTGAAGKPIVLIFVHDVNRQSISMTRTLSSYTASRSKDGLKTGIVWLSDDATEAEATLKRVQHALVGPDDARSAGILVKDLVGVSLEGREGPGSYGLNRNVMLTILVGKENKVTANFALIQPSIQVDLPKILEGIVAVVGGKAPKLEELPGMREMMQNRANSSSETPNLRPLLAPLIKKDATVEEVDKAAKAIQEKAKSDRSARAEIARIANTIVDSGKIENYGTPAAQEYLKRWAKEFKD